MSSTSPVRASTRLSISWSTSPPSENTDTLVLTLFSYSLDLRIYNTGPKQGKVDWCTVSRVSEGPGSSTQKPVLRWTPIISSRPVSASDPPDQGTFMTCPNGDVEEMGRMYNPDTGREEDYVEVWRRYPQPKGAEYCVLEREDGKAFLGRVGERALGIAWTRQDDGVMVWRDEWVDEAWKRLYEDGATGEEEMERVLPRLPEVLPRSWTEGRSVSLREAEWVIRVIGRLGI